MLKISHPKEIRFQIHSILQVLDDVINFVVLIFFMALQGLSLATMDAMMAAVILA